MPFLSAFIEINKNDPNKLDYRPCCYYEPDRYDNLNAPELQQLRQEFLDGKQPKACYKCWHDEDNNNKSLRQITTETLGHYKGEFNTVLTELKSVNFRMTSKCNFSCAMCWPGTSSFKKLEYDKLGIENEDYIIETNIDQHLPYFKELTDHAYYVEILGGEPSIFEEVYKLLDTLNKNITVYVVVNLSNYNERFVSKLKEFKNCVITCSIDGYGKYCEYQRYGSNWNKIEKYFTEYSNEFSTLINYVVTPISVYGYNDFIEWVPDDNYQLTFCQEPEKFNLNILPVKYKEQLAKEIDNEQLSNILTNGEEDVQLFDEMLQYLGRFDSLRGTNVYDIIPEWKDD